MLAKGLMFILVLLAAGCTMAPKYQRPEAPVPVSFPEYSTYSHAQVQDDADAGSSQTPDRVDGQSGESASAAAAWDSGNVAPLSKPEATVENQTVRGTSSNEGGDKEQNSEFPAMGNIAWSEFFQDPILNRLIGVAIEENRDLRVSMLNVAAARASYQVQRADLFPSISATGSNSNQRMPADIAGTPDHIMSRQSSATVGVTSYELDLFGRVRSLKDSALESYFQTAHNAHSARISLVSEVASAYLQLVAYKELRSFAEETYTTRQNSLKLTQDQLDSGVASQMVLNQARTLAEEARVSAVQYRTYELQAQNALVLLLGAPIPADIQIPDRLSDVQMLRDLPVGLPSDLLERRPDILAAEHGLKSANANIGAARASFFPRIGLTANLGYMSADLDRLFGGEQKTWTFAPAVSVPIFEGGRLLAGLRGAEVQREIAVATYEKSIQSAFREVADTLAQRSTIAEQLAAVDSLVEATQDTMDMALTRYDVGLDSYMDVLDAQRSYFTARQSQINTQLLRENNSLTLYKVLGGGWR